jgi:hypothetical protein
MEHLPIVISSIAAAISLAGLAVAIVAARDKRSEAARMVRSQIADVVSKLISAETEIKKLDQAIEEGAKRDTSGAKRGPPAARLDDAVKGRVKRGHPRAKRRHPEANTAQLRSLRHIVTQQRDSMAWQAHYLVNQSPQFVSDVEYAAVARGIKALDGDLADQYWQKSVAAAKGINRGKMMRSYALFLFARKEWDKGRHQFAEAARALQPVSDDHLWERMWVYLNWARSEAKAPGEGVAKPLQVADLVQKARDVCAEIGEKARQDEGRGVIAGEERSVARLVGPRPEPPAHAPPAPRGSP